MKSKKIILMLLTALSLFVVLTILVATENAQTHAFNHTLYAPLANLITPVLTTLATWIGRLTDWYSYTPILLLLLIHPRTRMKIGLLLTAAQTASAILGPVILKNIFAIERPDANQLIDVGGFGYPSGHSMNAAVFFGMCAVLVLRHSTNKSLKAGFTAFAIIAILLVGLSRIYLGVHTATDVIGGYLMGIVVICTVLLVENRLEKRSAEVGHG